MLAYFHSGDPITPAFAGASARKLASIADAFPTMKIVVAHLGGLRIAESKQYLMGKNVYLDTSWAPGLEILNPQSIVDLITGHGADRIIYGSDRPMTNAARDLKWIQDLPISKESKDRILFRNAMELLELQSRVLGLIAHFLDQ